MPFPLRLTTDLTWGLAVRALRLKHHHPLIFALPLDRSFSARSAALDAQGRFRLLDSVLLPMTAQEARGIPWGAVAELPPAHCGEGVPAR
jgi:hypothetical protein